MWSLATSGTQDSPLLQSGKSNNFYAYAQHMAMLFSAVETLASLEQEITIDDMY